MKKRLILVIVLIALVLTVVVTLFLLGGDDSTNDQTAMQEPVISEVEPEEQQKNYRVIFWTFEGDERGDTGRSYPTYKLWHQNTGGQAIEMDKIFGGSDGYLHIRDTQVSPDGSSVFLRYENKIERVNLDTEEVTIIASNVDGETYGGIVLSNDETKLLLSVNRTPFTEPTTLAEIDLATLEATEVFTGDLDEEGLTPLAQGEDDVWLVNFNRGFSGFIYGTYDPNTASLSDKTVKFIVNYSEDGSVLSYDSDGTTNVCDEFSGSSTTAHTVTNPYTGLEIGTISRPGQHIQIQEFSRDGSNVLLRIRDIPSMTEYDEAICNGYFEDSDEWELVSTDIEDTSPVRVSDAGEAYDIWYPNQPNPFVKQENDVCVASLLDGEVVTAVGEGFDRNIRIIRTVQVK